jgi:hypothetical protein
MAARARLGRHRLTSTASRGLQPGASRAPRRRIHQRLDITIPARSPRRYPRVAPRASKKRPRVAPRSSSADLTAASPAPACAARSGFGSGPPPLRGRPGRPREHAARRRAPPRTSHRHAACKPRCPITLGYRTRPWPGPKARRFAVYVTGVTYKPPSLTRRQNSARRGAPTRSEPSAASTRPTVRERHASPEDARRAPRAPRLKTPLTRGSRCMTDCCTKNLRRRISWWS